MSGNLEAEWKSSLTSILEELDATQYRKCLECLSEIPKSHKTPRSREKMPQKIIECYGLSESITVIRDIMDEIPRRDPTIQDLLGPFVNKDEKGKKGKKRKCDAAKKEKKPPAEKKRKCDAAKKEKKPPADQEESCRPDKKKFIRDLKSIHDLKFIRDLKSSSDLCDTIAGKVVQKSGLRTYQTKTNEKKFFFHLGVADETGSIKIMVYGKTFYQEFKEEKSYLFRKLIRDERGFKFNAQSKMSETRSVEVPEGFKMEARRLIYPESPLYSIAKAKLTADKTNVSVEGTVTEIDRIEPVTKLNKQKTKKQNFQLKDETDSIKICMWGEETKQCKGLSVGDVIKVTNTKTNKYYETVSLNSTGTTQIHKVQSLGIQKVKLEIVGIIKATKRETHLHADFNEQVHSFVVASGRLAKAFGFKLEGDFKESLLDKIPLSANAEIQGIKIKKITAA